MIGEGAHVEFIAWAYVGVALLTVAVTAWVAFDAVRAQRRLDALDKAGIRRRSAEPRT